MSYAELLSDPRWQKKRLEIMERDEWTCQTCGDTEATLTTHHKSYRMTDGKFADPWDYDNTHLITLCNECHSREETDLDSHKKSMYFSMRSYCENAETILLSVRLIKSIHTGYSRRVNQADIREIQNYINNHNFYQLTEEDNSPSMSEMLATLMGGKNDTQT